MDADQFQKYGREMVDYIADYMRNMRSRNVLPDVQPGYMKDLIPGEAPNEPEQFEDIMADIERVIMPGVTHWHHPQFHAYYVTANSFPALLGDMLSDAIACIGFSWIASPACTELEMITMDWLARALDLPKHFHFSEGIGGGVIQGSASDASLIALLACRSKVFREAKAKNPEVKIGQLLDRMVVYASIEAHSSVERACQIALVHCELLPTDAKRSLRGATLQNAIDKSRRDGLIPIMCFATLGTTSSCAFDNVEELGTVCRAESLWCHVDAAYAGSALLCPELRYLSKGIELVDSININQHKWMRVTFDCSALWLKDKEAITEAFNVDPLYLKNDYKELPEYRHWQIPLGRRFRSLKLWFVMRSFGITGLQTYIRKHISLAREFEELVRNDERFEIVNEVILALVCFRVKGPNLKTEELYEAIKKDKRIHLVPSRFNDTDTFFIRFCVCSPECESKDIRLAYQVISELTA